MKAWVALLAGVGVPLGLCAILFALSRGASLPVLDRAAQAGLASSALLGPLGAILGLLAAGRKVSDTPLRDAVQAAAIVPAGITMVVMLMISHEQGPLAAMVAAPFLFLPGPVAGGVAARLALWTPPAP
jgi:hypothetical protein